MLSRSLLRRLRRSFRRLGVVCARARRAFRTFEDETRSAQNAWKYFYRPTLFHGVSVEGTERIQRWWRR